MEIWLFVWKHIAKKHSQNDEIIALITKSLLKISISICDESPQADKKAIIKENDSHSQIMSFGWLSTIWNFYIQILFLALSDGKNGDMVRCLKKMMQQNIHSKWWD